MSEKKETKSETMKETLDDFLADIDEAKLRVSAGLDISPKLIIDDVGVENSKKVKVLSAPYTITIPVEKSMSDDNHLKVIDVEYEGIKHQFVAQAVSFRYQFGVIMTKLGFKKTEVEKMIGAVIEIWLEWVNLPKWGKQKLYQVALISEPPK